jgi:hypothetical protein
LTSAKAEPALFLISASSYFNVSSRYYLVSGDKWLVTSIPNYRARFEPISLANEASARLVIGVGSPFYISADFPTFFAMVCTAPNLALVNAPLPGPVTITRRLIGNETASPKVPDLSPYFVNYVSCSTR